MPARSKRLRRRGGQWLGVLALLWALQLVWIHQRLGRPTWSEYWRMREIYRPGIQAVDAGGGSVLPAYVFHPLSPNGAPWAFVLASGVYALAGTLLLWLMLRLSEKKRRGVSRSIRRWRASASAAARGES